MARTRRPYWLSVSVVYWGLTNLIGGMLFELSMVAARYDWATRFPLTLSLLAVHAALGLLYAFGRVAIVGMDGAPHWRPASLPEPGEPPPGNRLAWPASDTLPARVATPVARALTRRQRPVPRDLGKSPKSLVIVPMAGFVVAVLLTIAVEFADKLHALAYEMPMLGGLWGLWAASVWACITASIALQTRRINEDA